ncbi:MAG: OmpA family protein [Labilithrix sp.]|nr:OmpA family protein [Labilithrix sp.]MCW5816191.1 OmpA family protein [Labilithrix sp.]
MKITKLALGALTALAIEAVAGAASAQQTGFALDRYEPAERGSQFFVADTLDFRGHLRPALGATLDYGYKPLVAYDMAGNERASIVRHQLFTHLGGSLVLFDRFRFGLNAPVAVYQAGQDTVVNGSPFRSASKPAFGDVRLAADVRILGEYGDVFTLAGGVRAWLPTGARSQFTSDGSIRLAPQAMAAGDIGPFTYAARLALVYRARDDAYAGSPLGSELMGHGAFGLKTLDDKLVIGPEIFATSVFTDSASFFKTRGTPAEWLFGAHYDVGALRIGAGVGGGMTRGYGAPQLRTLLSIEYAPTYETPDRDKDGIPDREDACPDVPGVHSSDPNKNGCPPPKAPSDRDGDGIIDAEDACPDDPGPRTNDPKTNGCPDRDKDGIPDKLDACPDVPGVHSSDPNKNGCPPDRDGDGIADSEDACPDVPGVKDVDPKKNGCPPDRDADGVIDAEDACPDVPGPRDPDPKKNGCPLVVVTEKEIKILEQVKFKFDSAEILKESDTILDAVKVVLAAHPEIAKVRVEGHTDNVGRPEYNKSLSERRAASVMKWLTDRGIDKKRLVSQGFGQEQPIDDNKTDQGRANNRRVAFTILEHAAAGSKP